MKKKKTFWIAFAAAAALVTAIAFALFSAGSAGSLPDEGSSVSLGEEEWISPADQSRHTVESLSLGSTASALAETLNTVELRHKKMEDIYFYEMVPANAVHAGMLFLLHGQDSRKEEYLQDMAAYAEAGYVCVAPDIRGYGERASDQPIMAVQAAVTTGEDIDLLVSYYQTQSYANTDKIAVMGLSMGGSIAYWYAAYGKAPLSALIVGSTTPDWTRYHDDSCIVNAKASPGIWTEEELNAYLSRNNPVQNLRAFDALPILSGHGLEDPLIPIDGDEALERYLQAVGNRDASFYYFEGVGHDVPELFMQKVLPFLNRCL